MNKICTDIEQSQKLIELGIDTSSADMVYCVELYKEGWKYSNEPYPIDGTLEEDDIPAWSLSALLQLMPKVNGHYPDLCRGKETGLYYMWIEDEFDTQTYDDPIDAAIEMIEWLKENEKL